MSTFLDRFLVRLFRLGGWPLLWLALGAILVVGSVVAYWLCR